MSGSIFLIFTEESPMALGRNGERVANTPTLVLPPSRGGRTVADQLLRTASENCQMIHKWEKPSSPRNASGWANSFSNSILASIASTMPLCLGTPNLLVKSVRMWPMIFTGYTSTDITRSFHSDKSSLPFGKLLTHFLFILHKR